MEDIPKVLRSSLFDSKNNNKRRMVGSATSSQLRLGSSPNRKLTYTEMKRFSSGGFK